MNRIVSLALLTLLFAMTPGLLHASAAGGSAGSGSGDKSGQLGKRQHKPMDEPPAGATARCNDGTYSTDKNRKTACSANGGIAKWLKG
jgi:hypothetical protein